MAGSDAAGPGRRFFRPYSAGFPLPTGGPAAPAGRSGRQIEAPGEADLLHPAPAPWLEGGGRGGLRRVKIGCKMGLIDVPGSIRAVG